MEQKRKKSGKYVFPALLLCIVFTMCSVFGTQGAFAEGAQSAGYGGAEKEFSLPTETAKGGSLAASDKLLSGYLMQQGAEEAGSGSIGIKSTRGSRLTRHNRLVYDRLKEMAVKVAAGELADTTVRIPLKDFGIDTSYTAEELGVSTLTDGSGNVTEAARSAINEKFQVTIELVLYALLEDCPYELYWYDKTKGLAFVPPSAALVGDYAVTFERNAAAEFKMTAASAYAVDPYAEDRFAVDTQKTKAAASAAFYAGEIVNQYAGKSDEQKLRGYAKEIIDLVDYDNDAAVNYGETEQYGDPWQIIYVFDRDHSTNVVCEGYSKAYQYLCDLTGFSDPSIECSSMTGDMYAGKGDTPAGSGPHMWNTVKIGDYNYLVDVTNSDDNSGKSTGVPKNGELILGGAKEYESGGYSGYQVKWGDDEWIVYFYDEQSVRTFTDEERILSDKSYARRIAGESGTGGSTGGSGTGGGSVKDEKISVTFELDAGGSDWILPVTVSMPKGSTAAEVFEKVLSDNGYSYRGSTSYVTAITNPSGVTLAEKDHGSNSGWMYRLNGSIADKSLAQQVLNNGDSIRFFYTDDYTKESGLPGGGSGGFADPGEKTGGAGGTKDDPAGPDKPGQVPAAAKLKKPADAKIVKLKSTKRKTVTVIWKKVLKNNKGYQIMFSRNKNMKKARTVTVNSAKTTKKTIKKLRSGKKYYFRIRAFNKNKKQTVYSKWSSRKAVRVK